jgi:hypothetical protein
MTDTQKAPAPSLIPSQATGASTAAGRSAAPGTTAPEQLPDETMQALTGGSTAAGAPTLLPPGAEGAAAATAGAGAVTATWRTNVQISALWSIDEVRNAWAFVVGIGWKKLYNGRDGAFAALATLAAQARQTGRNVSLREEADGMIYEIYLW